MRDRLQLLLLLLVAASTTTATRHVPPRRSCRDHYLAGHVENGVYPIKLHKTHTANVACRMPYSGAPQAVVTTVIRSALERGLQVTDARTVQWQLDDFTILRDVIERSTSCKQTIHVNRTAPGEGQTRSPLPEPGVTLHSILGETRYISGEQEDGSIELFGSAAGILHVVPDDPDYELNPYIVAGELICEEFVRKYDECLIDGGVLIDTTTSAHAHFRFAFRTDASNQPLLTAHHEGGARTVVELTDDFFLDLGDGTDPLLVGHVSDGKWHTAQIALDGTHFSLDGGGKIALPAHGPVKQVSIRINGWIMLTDPMDEAEGCIDSKRISKDPVPCTIVDDSGQPSHTRPFCAGASPCECTMLDEHFSLLPSTTCVHEEAVASEFTLIRHPDLLSFLMLPDALISPSSSSHEEERRKRGERSIQGTPSLALSLTFKSDSDSGLLLFGEWRNITWGRVQVHYHGEKLTAVHCTQQDENSIEICRGCSIDRTNGYGTDTWTRVTTFTARDGQLFLTVDAEICELTEEGDYDTAEMYKTVLTRGSVLFVGGMFNKKVKPGIYKDEFKAKFFENTREKLPSLRGCVKDVFALGKRVDVLKEFENQWRMTLISPSAEKYAVRMGCGHCPTQCPLHSRCRPVSNELYAESTCNCADVEQYKERTGECVKQKTGPISLSRSSLATYRGEFAVSRRGMLGKIWIKLKLPSHPVEVDTPLIHFYSHGKSILFRLYLTPDGKLAVQVHPEHRELYTPNASKFLDPSDDRIHLVTFEKRTPLGTHPSRRFYDLYIDGERFTIPDPSIDLTAIEFNLVDSDEGQGGCVSDLGLSYDFDDQHSADIANNRMETVNVLEHMYKEMADLPSHEQVCGVVDPLLWTRGAPPLGPLGILIDHRPDVFERQDGGPNDTSMVSDSIDRTDFSMYDEPKLHRCKVDRESMISFVEPTADRPVQEAAIVVRSPTPNYSNAPIVRDDQSDLGY
ncbi:bam-2 [Pristionchus pacificus]|uniref:Bam-2 n=1 Tax=Pristionchus pacificus TaxID=54126 RepID=A0A2A6BV49_PRIPA|nr:bam-2 [Pristionchus pacificus]|eukprot:PDM69641.1 bam-2 [Pristionchus pacificus]